jgi:hypothetical protein
MTLLGLGLSPPFDSLGRDMTNTLTLASELDATDFQTYLGRASQLGCASVRLIGAGAAVAAYVPVLTPSSLLDQAPTVLGLRVCERSAAEAENRLDTVVSIRALLDRLAHDTASIPLPPGEAGAPWVGISAPRTGWEPRGTLSEVELQVVAQAGITEVAAANGLGVNIVQTVRNEVWGRPVTVTTASDEPLTLPAGAAFAALGLGFLGTAVARVSTSGNWRRLTTERGYVLVR